MDVAVIRNLPHHAIYDEAIGAVLGLRHYRQHSGHERAFRFGGGGAMLPEDGHRSIARVAVENRESKRVQKVAVPERVIAQLAEFALRHRANAIPARAMGRNDSLARAGMTGTLTARAFRLSRN